jgi:branched-chain amino acid transport system permease protein
MARRLGTTLAPAALVLLVQLVFFPVPAGVWVRGAVVGGLTSLVALGMALVYRANRILNFAQGDLGAVPSVMVFLLITSSGWNYFLALTAGLAASLVLGGLVELVVIRRFFRAPRLLLTVATIGLSQVLAASAVLLPRLWHERLLAPVIAPPFHLTFTINPMVFGANDVIAMVAIPLLAGGLAVFLRFSHAGVAIRAAADNADRAGSLGVPVKRLHTMVWAIAGGLGFAAIFLRAGILGLPIGATLGFTILLRALAALMLGQMTDLGAIAASGVALGVLELGVNWNASSPLLADPVLAAVIVAALLIRRRSSSRAESTDTSTWQAAEETRPVPPELARLPEVRLVRWGGALVLAGVVLALPHVLSVDRSLKASAVIIYAILGVSLVVLTGWAGQVSLGQVAFFALGAALGGKATVSWHLDLTLALLLSTAAGALASVIIGLPALRLKGLYLAVTTFAFALAATSWFLNPRFFGWIPQNRIPRPALFGRVSIDSPTRIYYLALAGLVIVLVAARGVRRSRTGRVLIALRENERAAAAYGIDPVRAKLTAFALSGAIAAFAGCLFVHHQQAFGVGPYDPGQNLAVFTMVIIGGVGSLPGAILGALYLRGTQWFLPADWQFLATGAGALLVLVVAPYGLGGLASRLRDQGLRAVAKRRAIDVPSLTADSRRPKAPPAAESVLVGVRQ